MEVPAQVGGLSESGSLILQHFRVRSIAMQAKDPHYVANILRWFRGYIALNAKEGVEESV